MSAPHLCARARRPGEKSLATMVSTPSALSWQITARPTGPQPITTAVSRLLISLRRTACRATAIGSVSAATSISRPLGTANVMDASTRTRSAYPPGANGDRPVSCTPPCARTIGKDTTRVPVLRPFAALGPRSATTPANSWPITVGVLRRMQSW